ncbi:MAG: ABC transporter permease [Asgard group archaeon]|nr:ABC transporter permease [Asgard group archaeon]
MKEIYTNLTELEKKVNWTTRFGSLYRLYLGKLWSTLIKDGKTWIFNILMILPIIAGPFVALFSTSITVDKYYSLYSNIMFMGYFGLIIPLFTMYIATMMFNDEIGDRSITYLTVRPLHRFEIVMVKYLSYLSIIPIFTVICTGLNYLSFGAFGGFQYVDMALWFILTALISSAVYGAFFMFIGLLFKNPLWFGLFFTFIWEFVFAGFSVTLNRLTIAYYIKSLIVFDIYPNDPFRYSPAVFIDDINQAHLFQVYNNPANLLTVGIVLLVVVIVSITLSWSLLQGDRFKIPYKAGTRPGGWKYYLKEIRSFLITFGIVLLTLGIVIAPVSGTKKSVTNYYGADMNINEYPNFESAGLPTMSDMGYGSYIQYSFSKGDDVSFIFELDYVSHSTYTIYSLLVDEESFSDFYSDTQQLFLAYRDLYYQTSGTYERQALYHELLANYTTKANQLLVSTPVKIRLYQGQERTLNYLASENVKLYILTILTNFDYDYGEDYLYASADITVDGYIFRRTGYATGWIMVGVGIISSSFAVYSLITYKSADEIRRYEEQIALHTEAAEKKDIQVDSSESCIDTKKKNSGQE